MFEVAEVRILHRNERFEECLCKSRGVFGTYNHFDNILRHFDVLPSFPFAIISFKHGIRELLKDLKADSRV